jgi:hypothetical protein
MKLNLLKSMDFDDLTFFLFDSSVYFIATLKQILRQFEGTLQ